MIIKRQTDCGRYGTVHTIRTLRHYYTASYRDADHEDDGEVEPDADIILPREHFHHLTHVTSV